VIVLTPAQMREADARAAERVTDVALMRAAGERIAAVVEAYAAAPDVVAFAGPGNNGGDAFAACAMLSDRRCTIYAQAAPNPSAARRDAEERAQRAGVRVLPFPNSQAAAARALSNAGAALVGLVGTGARLPLPQLYVDVIRAVNDSGVPAIAIDIPAGTGGDSGTVVEPALRAAATIALGAVKIGLLLQPARDCVGNLWLGEIGMPAGVLEEQEPRYAALDDAEFPALLPQRAAASDKRSSGAPLIIAGSEQFPGAAILSAMGAARAGAGYVTLATPAAAAPAIRTHLLEQVAITFDPASGAENAIRTIADAAERCGSIGIGPGLGLDDVTGEIVRGVAQRIDLPIVADASALFHFAKRLDLLARKRAIVTPHAGEFARLSGKGTVKEEERVARVREFVDRTHVATLLKGEATLICGGETMHVNTTGTPALATAGTGDVLTGIIATLLAQGLSPVDAARAGAYWHGLAAKCAAARRPYGVIARDVYDALGAAVPQHVTERPPLRRIF
jgi:hydroxyethylthiazole kinase-like uncharacterized protein yjeF